MEEKLHRALNNILLFVDHLWLFDALGNGVLNRGYLKRSSRFRKVMCTLIYRTSMINGSATSSCSSIVSLVGRTFRDATTM